MNKFYYLNVLQGFYCGRWEDLTASENLKEVKNDKKSYQENEKGSYRIIKRRELMKTIVIRGCIFKVSKAQYEELMKMEKELIRQDWTKNRL